MTSKLATRVAALMGFLAVSLGAFGAHGLEHLLKQNNMVDVWKTAVLYHFIHAVMLFVVGQREPVRKGPWVCFLVGIIVFSGSLYLLAATNIKWLGAITPIGGVSFLVGWAWLFVSAGKRDQ